MSAKNSVERVCEEVIEQNATDYAKMLEMPHGAVRDESLRTMVAAFECMDDSQKDAVA